jgi:DNA-binding transcriptional LysR family regulator
MELSQLRTLIHVAELGSLSKAADRMHIAQPALSRQVRMLEEELGLRLFDRHGRGMVLTDQGRDVLAHALRVMAELEEMRGHASVMGAELTGQVAIGFPPTVADILSVPLAAAFGASHPRASLRLVSAYTGYLLDWLHRGEIDLAILYDPHVARSLRSTPLLLESLFLIGPPGSPLTRETTIRFSDLTGQRLFLPSPRHGLRGIVDQAAKQAGIRLTVPVEADSYATLKDLVRHGDGCTILPLAPIHDDIATGRLTSAAIVEPELTRRLVLSYPADRPAPRLARFAGEEITRILRDLVARGVWSGSLAIT